MVCVIDFASDFKDFRISTGITVPRIQIQEEDSPDKRRDNSRFIKSAYNALSKDNFEKEIRENKQRENIFKISSLLHAPEHLTTGKNSSHHRDKRNSNIFGRKKLKEYFKATENPFKAKKIFSQRARDKLHPYKNYDSRRTKPETGSRRHFPDPDFESRKPSFKSNRRRSVVTDSTGKTQNASPKKKKMKAYENYLGHISRMKNGTKKSEYSTNNTVSKTPIDSLDQVKNEWLPGAIRCCERKHVKKDGDKIKQSILKIFDFKDGSKEIVEWSIQEVIEDNDSDILNKHLNGDFD